MVPSLPYDVWCLIAKYLPKTTLLRLYGVNANLFDLAMNEQYREVTIYHSHHESTQRCLSTMGPAALKRVRALILRPHLYGGTKLTVTSKTRSNVFEKMIDFVNRTRKFDIGSRELAPSQALIQIRRRVEEMTEVTSLTIACYPCDSLQTFHSATALISSAWSTHGSQLTTLTLNIPLEAYPSVISSAPTIAALEELNITLNLEYATTVCEEILKTIAAFVELHASSLTSLSIDTPSASIDPFSLFSNIPHLPHLTKLFVLVCLDRLRPGYTTGVDKFLANQASLLKDLKLRFYGPNYYDPPPTPDALFSHPILQVQFPSLTSLDLGLCHWPKELKNSVKDNLVNYLRPMRNSLKTLAISQYVLAFTQVQDLVALFSGERSQLQSLEIHMYFLSCDLLDLLYKQLPRLSDLELRFDSLVSQDDGLWNPNYYWNGYDTRAAAFVQDMATRKYPDWSLRRLTVKPLYYCSGRWNECRTLLAAALPAVISFNGLSGVEFADIPDFTRPKEL